ncbi:hypothetical protein BU17DRAFT_61872 [Hysterangium stoloniferum]|nr:hypothetical protein BU17DRAFT_61872 [Hysterangium stoloniferum]
MRLRFGRYLSHLLGFPAFHTFAFVSIAAVVDCDIGGSCDGWCLEKVRTFIDAQNCLRVFLWLTGAIRDAFDIDSCSWLLHTWQSLHSIPSGEDSLSFQLTIDLSGWPSSGSMGAGIFGSSECAAGAHNLLEYEAYGPCFLLLAYQIPKIQHYLP